MNDYSIIETKPVNLAVIVVLFILLLCFAGAAGVYYTKSHILEVELAHERSEHLKTTDKVDYLEQKSDALQSNYVDLILTGYVRVGPNDMRDLVQQAKYLRQAANENYPTHEGIGGEDPPVVQTKKKAKRKGKRKKRKKATGQ